MVRRWKPPHVSLTRKVEAYELRRLRYLSAEFSYRFAYLHLLGTLAAEILLAYDADGFKRRPAPNLKVCRHIRQTHLIQ